MLGDARYGNSGHCWRLAHRSRPLGPLDRCGLYLPMEGDLSLTMFLIEASWRTITGGRRAGVILPSMPFSSFTIDSIERVETFALDESLRRIHDFSRRVLRMLGERRQAVLVTCDSGTTDRGSRTGVAHRE